MMRGHLSSWIEEISAWQTNKQPSLTSGYPWPSNTVKSPGFFKPGSCLSFFLETFILQDYRSFSSSSSSIIFFFQDEELGWWDGWRDGWMERTTTTGQNQGYYIRRWIDLHTYIDTWVESSYTSAYHYKKKSKDLLFVSWCCLCACFCYFETFWVFWGIHSVEACASPGLKAKVPAQELLPICCNNTSARAWIVLWCQNPISEEVCQLHSKFLSPPAKTWHPFFPTSDDGVR
jgi:hypothetical protein